jgi:cytidylate kinase
MLKLTCSEEELIKRIKEDIKCGKRDVDNIDRSLERLRLYANMDTTKIDTTNKDIDIIVEEIEELLDK